METPRKASKRVISTPSKDLDQLPPAHPARLDPYDSPAAIRQLCTPTAHRQVSPPMSLKSALGPTPQRDGKVLGLFDLLSASGGSTATPMAKRMATLEADALQTPSRKRKLADIAEENEDEDATATPPSSGKFYLDRLFATPSTMRYASLVENEENGFKPQQPAPAETNQPESDTPLFLRRGGSGRCGTGDISPITMRKPPKFGSKSLSALVQGWREIQEEKKQEEQKKTVAQPEVEHPAPVPENDERPPEQPQPVRKKRGQKRTTRLVKLKPIIPPRKKTCTAISGANGVDHPESESDDELLTVTPSKRSTQPHLLFDRPGSSHSSGNEDDNHNENDSQQPDLHSSTSKFGQKVRAALSAIKNSATSKSSSKDAKNKKRKINPEAHANYRALKIRSRNEKGKGQGRFKR